jgi:hypothetical protein
MSQLPVCVIHMGVQLQVSEQGIQYFLQHTTKNYCISRTVYYVFASRMVDYSTISSISDNVLEILLNLYYS